LFVIIDRIGLLLDRATDGHRARASALQCAWIATKKNAASGRGNVPIPVEL
jgi:hypothetical protein